MPPLRAVAPQLGSLADLKLLSVQIDRLQRWWVPDWAAMGRVFRLGWPIGGQLLAEVGLFAGSSVLMGWVGEIALAAHGVALQMAS